MPSEPAAGGANIATGWGAAELRRKAQEQHVQAKCSRANCSGSRAKRTMVKRRLDARRGCELDVAGLKDLLTAHRKEAVVERLLRFDARSSNRLHTSVQFATCSGKAADMQQHQAVCFPNNQASWEERTRPVLWLSQTRARLCTPVPPAERVRHGMRQRQRCHCAFRLLIQGLADGSTALCN